MPQPEVEIYTCAAAQRWHTDSASRSAWEPKATHEAPATGHLETGERVDQPELDVGGQQVDVFQVLEAVLDNVPEDVPLPDAILITRHTDQTWVVRYDVHSDDQPRTNVVTIGS